MWPYSWTHVGTPSHLGHMDRVAATMPSQAHAGAAQEAPNIGQWEGQDVPLVRPSSCTVKGGIPSSRRYLPTYLCGGPEETPAHMHVGCAHLRLLWPHYHQAVQEAARHPLPGDKETRVASWRSAGVEWMEVFCSGLVHEVAEAQLRAIARYDPPGGTSLDEFVQHMLRLGDFVWGLRNHRLEQLLRAPLSAAARVHRWLTAAEGDSPPPFPRALAGTSWPPSAS